MFVSIQKRSGQIQPLVWIALFAIACGLIWFFLVRQPSKTKSKEAPVAVPAAVVVGKPAKVKIVEWDEFVGRLEAIETVEVRARVSGYLASTHFIEGQLIKAGDLLAVIDQRQFKAEVTRNLGDLEESKGKLEQAKSALLQSKAEAERARVHKELTAKQLERIGYLRKQNAASQEDLDVAQAAFLEAEADVSVANSKIDSANSSFGAAQASVDIAAANLELARLNLAFTEVRAPIDGRISRRYVTEGNMISGGTNDSTLLTTIVSQNPIHCYFDADEQKYLNYMKLARQGSRASSRDVRNPVFVALADDVNAYPYRGHMDFVDNRIDRETGTIRGRAILANDELALTPGMFAKLRLPGSAPYEAILIPDRAIGTDQAEKFVLVVDNENKVSRRVVKLGPYSHGLRIIRDGLTGEELVITSGLQKTRPGNTVKPTEQPIEPGKEVLPDHYEPVSIENALTPKRQTAANVTSPDDRKEVIQGTAESVPNNPPGKE